LIFSFDSFVFMQEKQRPLAAVGISFQDGGRSVCKLRQRTILHSNDSGGALMKIQPFFHALPSAGAAALFSALQFVALAASGA
jgi:hypothetical protein